MVYWITGKANAGKTTIAHKISEIMKGLNIVPYILDGDDVRQYSQAGFSDEERRNHIRTIASFAAIAEKQEIMPIIALVSPKVEWRKEAISLFDKCYMIYVEGGTLWEGTWYEEPDGDEPVLLRGDVKTITSMLEGRPFEWK